MKAMTRGRAIIGAGGILIVLAGAWATHFPALASRPPGPGATKTGRAVVLLNSPLVPAAGEASAVARHERLARAKGAIAAVSRAHRLDVVGAIPQIGVAVADPGREGIAALRAELAGDPRVEAVQPEYRRELRSAPNDPVFRSDDPNAPGADRAQWNLIGERFPGAWRLSHGAAATVAVIDTGADLSHPDLDNASRIDCTSSCQAGGDVSDGDGHGTHTAGLACADSNNGYGLASSGFDCRLLVIETDFTDSSIAESILAAANRHADVISMSFGGSGPSQEIRDALTVARSAGSVPVAAAANDPLPGVNYPAQYLQPQGSGPSIKADRGLVVTAARHSRERAGFAEKDSGVSVAAFGSAIGIGSGGQEGILSTWPAGPVLLDVGDPLTIPPVPPCQCRTEPPGAPGDDRFAYLEGTSMAAPQVAGLVGLIRSVGPRISVAKVTRIVKLTADGGGRYGRGLGWGIIDARSAVAAALGHDITPPVSRVRSAHAVRGAAASRGRLISLRIKRFDRKPPGLAKSGVRSVTVFVSVNGHRFHPLAKTRRRTLRIGVRGGRDYAFYTRATDRAGNREPAPAHADATLSL